MVGQGENGWIKLSRKIVNHWIWDDAERLKWWLDLLMMAAWEERKQLIGRKLVTLYPGQLIASVSFLCERWKRSRTMIDPFLDLLIQDKMIKKDVSHNISIISILNYGSYQISLSDNDAHLLDYSNKRESIDKMQDVNHSDAHLDTHSESYLDAHLDAINKEDKEYNIYNNNSSSFHSDESEVRELHADPAEKKKRKIEDKANESCNGESPKQADLFNVAGLVKFWNDEMDANKAIVRRIHSLSGSRRKWVNARIREHGKEAVIEVVRKVARSDFLNGKNGRSWTATFDWVFGVNNFQKVMEGNFDNDSNNQVKSIVNESCNDKEGRFDKRRGYDAALHEVSDYETGF